MTGKGVRVGQRRRRQGLGVGSREAADGQVLVSSRDQSVCDRVGVWVCGRLGLRTKRSEDEQGGVCL